MLQGIPARPKIRQRFSSWQILVATVYLTVRELALPQMPELTANAVTITPAPRDKHCHAAFDSLNPKADSPGKAGGQSVPRAPGNTHRRNQSRSGSNAHNARRPLHLPPIAGLP